MSKIRRVESTDRATDAKTPEQPHCERCRSDGPFRALSVSELATAARLTDKARKLPDVRTDLVERVKAQIAAGKYDTPERIDIAAQRLLRELLSEL